MVIDHHFGFIALSWLAGVAGFAGLGIWLWQDRRSLDRQLDELEGNGRLPRETAASEKPGGES